MNETYYNRIGTFMFFFLKDRIIFELSKFTLNNVTFKCKLVPRIIYSHHENMSV